MCVGARSFFPVLLGVAAIGCQAPARPTGPTDIVLRIPDYERFIDATLTVLREHDFQPRRVDRAEGVAVTHPTTGGQWFEFWRADSRGGYQLLESSIHTIRRIVTVNVRPVAAEREPLYRVSVQVDKSRHSAPERQVTTASGALAIYSEKLPTTEGLMAARSAGEHWVPLGRDAALEAYLLDKITHRLPDVELAQAATASTEPQSRRAEPSASGVTEPG